jgi:hypothetical protein
VGVKVPASTSSVPQLPAPLCVIPPTSGTELSGLHLICRRRTSSLPCTSICIPHHLTTSPRLRTYSASLSLPSPPDTGCPHIQSLSWAASNAVTQVALLPFPSNGRRTLIIGAYWLHNPSASLKPFLSASFPPPPTDRDTRPHKRRPSEPESDPSAPRRHFPSANHDLNSPSVRAPGPFGRPGQPDHDF